MSCIWRFMYHDVLKPGDTFPMMMRKMVLAIGAIAGIVPMLILIQVFMGLTSKNSSTYPRFISFVVIQIGSWIYVKRTHTAPTWLIAVWINSMSSVTLLNMLFSPKAPYEFALKSSQRPNRDHDHCPFMQSAQREPNSPRHVPSRFRLQLFLGACGGCLPLDDVSRWF